MSNYAEQLAHENIDSMSADERFVYLMKLMHLERSVFYTRQEHDDEFKPPFK